MLQQIACCWAYACVLKMESAMPVESQCRDIAVCDAIAAAKLTCIAGAG